MKLAAILFIFLFTWEILLWLFENVSDLKPQEENLVLYVILPSFILQTP